MKHNRPVNLDLMTLKFPATAISSILHRISGLFLFILLPGVLYLFSLSTASAEGFHQAKVILNYPLIKVAAWAFLVALTFHLLAGIRHIMMDLGFGEGLPTGKYTAFTVIGLTFILTIILGIWIW